MYIHGNKFVGCKEGVKGTSDKPIDAPAIVPAFTTNLEALEKQLMSESDGAGCMPRDKVDKLYLTQKEGIAHGDHPFRIPDTGQPLPN